MGIMYEEEMLKRAVSAYFRYGEGELDQPNAGISCIQNYNGKDYCILRNIRGVLAVYRIKNDGFLKRLKRYPNEFDNLF
jgi:hypothetical protein